MSQNDSFRSKRYILFSALILSLFGSLIGYRFFQLDFYLTNTMVNIFQHGQVTTSSRIFQDTAPGAAMHLFVYFLVSLAGTTCGYILKGNTRILSLFQLSIIVLVIQVMFSGFWIPLLSLGSMLLTVFLSFGAGVSLTRLNQLISSRKATLIAADPLHQEPTQKDLNLATLKIIKSDEIDRRTLAADLHDQVLHGLKVTRQKFQTYQNTATKELAEEIDHGLAKAMDEIREVMDSLSPSALENLGFSDAIEELIRNGAVTAGYRIRYRCDLDDKYFDRFSKIEISLLYRIVQESVNNIVKHACATKVRCLISDRENKLHITISDNGKGFDTNNLNIDSRGIQYMLQRASIINANVNWRKGEKDSGTVIDISI